MLSKVKKYILKPAGRLIYKKGFSPNSRIRRYILEPPVGLISKFIYKEAHTHDAKLKRVSEMLLPGGAKVVEKYIPDKLLLVFVNALDKRASPETIDAIVGQIEKHVSENVRASLIAVADEWVPDTVANSRKVSAIIAGVGKYVPDEMIPADATEKWSHLKTKFSIPTLLTKKRKSTSMRD